MLDNVDLRVELDRESYREKAKELMWELHLLQERCWQEKLGVIVVLEGWAAAGKGKAVKKMTKHMDPRGFRVHPTLPPTPEEQKYPFLWRFWQKLPPHGRIDVFYHSWYTHVLEDRLFGRVKPQQVPLYMRDINAFERQLADGGYVIIKFWLHLSEKELKKRLKSYEKDELESWRVRKEDWQQLKNYEKYKQLAEEMLIYTSTGVAPWIVVEANCQRWARVKILTQMVARIKAALAEKKVLSEAEHIQVCHQEQLSPTEPDFLAKVDLSLSLPKSEYKKILKEYQVRLRRLQKEIFEKNIGVVMVFEGWDAAGKGGTIKRVTDILDPRSYEVHAFAAPSPEEKQYHYLWRFWRSLTPLGKIAIFDRSWYGRVLVERVEGFATETEWRRAYREINEFEAQLATCNYLVLKFWLHISPEEQLKRFQERQNDPYKNYKLTEEDWRNREKWNLYYVAVNQAIAQTSTALAPWQIVSANSKYYARIQVLDTTVEAIRKKLGE